RDAYTPDITIRQSDGDRGSGLASAGGQTNPLVLSLSKDEPWDARGSTGSPRAWEPISARSKLDLYGRPPSSLPSSARIAGRRRRVIGRGRRPEQPGEDRLQAVRPDLVALDGRV